MFNLLHISTGDLFRYEIGNKTPLGLEAKSYMNKGKLVPDEVTIGMLKNKVEANPDVAGYIFDGFPRTIPQCAALDKLLESNDQDVSRLIALKVNDEEIISRLLKRGEISGRADDQDESVIRKRIDVYNAETAPVFAYYDEKGKSTEIEGIGSIDEIFDKLQSEVSKLA
jgi:adenylate kinase